jgi:hypothetical protein
MEDESVEVSSEEMKNLNNPDYNRVIFDSFSFRLKQAKNSLYRISRMESSEEMIHFAKKALDILEPGWRTRTK